MPLTIHQGMAGVASWLIGALLIVAGLGLWFQQQQHSFYGILALLLAVTSFVTSNLGGFVLGMLLGMIGGALGFAWAPREAVRADPDASSSDTGRHRAVTTTTEPPARSADPYGQATAAGGSSAGVFRGGTEIGGTDGRRTGRAMAVAALPAVLGASLFGTAPSEPSPGPLPPLVILPTPDTTATPTPPGTATPTPPLGVATPPPAVTVTPSPTAPAAKDDTSCPAPPSTAGMSRQEALKAMKEAAPCVKPAKARAASGLPVTTTDAVTLRADRMSMSGLSYDGVVELPTGQGSVRALRFTMDKGTMTTVDQTIRHGQDQTRATATSLAFSGDVVMYTTKMSGKVFGLLPMTFTPDSPPPLVPSSMSLTEMVAEQPHVLADSAHADGFTVGA
jgi:hypothetical protein